MFIEQKMKKTHKDSSKKFKGVKCWQKYNDNIILY